MTSCRCACLPASYFYMLPMLSEPDLYHIWDNHLYKPPSGMRSGEVVILCAAATHEPVNFSHSSFRNARRFCNVTCEETLHRKPFMEKTEAAGRLS